MKMSNVRGTSFQGTLDYVRVIHGEEALRNVIGQMPEDLQKLLAERGHGFLPSSWYPVKSLSEMTRVIDRSLGKGDLALVRAIGKHVAFADVNRFFTWLFRFAGPKLIFPRAASVWSNYYDTGKYVVEEATDQRASIRIEDWEAADEILCKRLEGWIERAMELTIGANHRAVIRETHHRAADPQDPRRSYCRFEVRWDS
ncbi:MAG: hypothetical protein MUF51_08615 [Vicinamibacteria bacterium]|jgi:hypothetical protein|nr:hypothetical protein [Vicinamibacteria bacterium]